MTILPIFYRYYILLYNQRLKETVNLNLYILFYFCFRLMFSLMLLAQKCNWRSLLSQKRLLPPRDKLWIR